MFKYLRQDMPIKVKGIAKSYNAPVESYQDACLKDEGYVVLTDGLQTEYVAVKAAYKEGRYWRFWTLNGVLHNYEAEPDVPRKVNQWEIVAVKDKKDIIVTFQNYERAMKDINDRCDRNYHIKGYVKGNKYIRSSALKRIWKENEKDVYHVITVTGTHYMLM